MELSDVSLNPLGNRTVSQDGVTRIRHKSTVSTLLSKEYFEKSDNSLGYFLQKNRDTNVLLRILGVIWGERDEETCWSRLQYVWNGLLRFLLLGNLSMDIILVTLSSWQSHSWAVYLIVYFGALLLQSLALLLSLGDVRRRLRTKVSSFMILHLSKSVNIAYLVLVVVLLVGLVPAIVSVSINLDPVFVYLILGETPLCIFLAAALFFVSTDCSIALFLLEELNMQRELQLLTFEQYDLTRKEIKSIQASSSWINNAVVVVALVNIVAIFLLIILVGPNSAEVGYEIVLISFLVKEIPFPMIVYWKVAQVNEKASQFQSDLASMRWVDGDAERVAICQNVQANPICMSLAGMKLKRMDLVWQFGAWLLALGISILKTFVQSHLV